MNGHTFNTSPWDDEADGTFFGLTATLFPTAFTYGASVLLASYDPDDVATVVSAPAQPVDPQRTITVTAEFVAWTRGAES